jgi:hypothetical protein
MSDHVVAAAPCSIIAALTSSLFPNLLYGFLMEQEVQSSTYCNDDRRCSFLIKGYIFSLLIVLIQYVEFFLLIFFFA